MGLFEMTVGGELVPVPSSTFAAEQILERADLQRALREHIAAPGEDLLVVAEEFGDFEVRRRIDLLCVDRSGRLVVVELKRTEDGGHMELQALRYAAMVSAMTFEQLVDTYQRHLARTDPGNADGARKRLAERLDEAGGDSAVIQRQVRIILASAGFDPQITTTVLWLNDIYGLDITCIRLTPYRIGERRLLDVQQVIPLPEAAELTVQLRRRETAARAAEASSGRDLTRYVIITPSRRTGALPKRRALLALISALHEAGVDVDRMAEALPGWPRLLPVDGILVGDAHQEAFVRAHGSGRQLERWFFESPIHRDGRTWVLSKMWGADTVDALDALLGLAPTPGYDYEPVGAQS
ncbi:hypothetical protein DKT69_08910 [Micromonospora sicca]|uniref:DUF91 domain-containing protein n=2 Tax=Micromonosporaceae TaxID=28056 RepID=A0A317DMF2_9ACTN|nr:hypothetical protein DKT69_08910 [Micromonospora sp. 4G51]